MNLLKNIAPIEKGYQILYKTVAMGTNKKIWNIRSFIMQNKYKNWFYKKEEDNEVDKNAIAIYMSGTKKYFIFLKKK